LQKFFFYREESLFKVPLWRQASNVFVLWKGSGEKKSIHISRLNFALK